MAVFMDRTLDFVRHGYRSQDRLRARSRDAAADRRLPVRFVGGDALLVKGLEGVRLFYDTSKVKRDGAMPGVIRGGLFGQGSVHGLDDEQHRRRKATFVRAVMDPAASDALLSRARDEVGRVLDTWSDGQSVYDAMTLAYGRAAVVWAGFSPEKEKLDEIARWQGQIVDGFGVIGPEYVRHRLRRRQLDAWFEKQVKAARAGDLDVPAGSPFRQMLDHVDADGRPLSDRTTAVEVQNVIRPTIATARFAAFAAKALHENPAWREKIRTEALERGVTWDGPVAEAFAEEVRRYYPFVPLLPSVARTDFEHQGIEVKKGDRVLVDIYGSMRDPEYWDHPETFDPARFLETEMQHSEVFVPQGGADVNTGHRCPGEIIVVGLLALTVAELSVREWTVPPQDLDYSMSRLPALPADGVKLAGMSSPGR